jgi:RNA exonuclease 4
VDEHGNVLLDLKVKPRQQVLDYRTHMTGLTKESLVNAVEFDTARSRLLELLQPQTLLVGYRLATEIESLKLWHGTVVDVSLLFGVETRKQHQFHPLRYLAENVLGAHVEEHSPHDALEDAQLVLRLAQHEVKLSAPTAPFPPKPGNDCELAVRHVPLEWRKEAVKHISNLIPGSKRDFVVNWLLSEADPTDWRGEAVLEFHTAIARDAAFEALSGLTDVHVQWEDLPGAPPLGAFMTEQNLIKAFSLYGMVVSTRVPRKPTTREPQSFAFISFLNREDAQRVAKQQSIEVELGPDWLLPLRPRLAKFGQSTDKRVAVPVGTGDDVEFAPMDWVHIFRR